MGAEAMRKVRLIGVLTVAVAAAAVSSAGDWKGDLARKAVTRAVQEALEDAMQDAALDAALDAVAPAAATYAASRLRDIDTHDAIGETVSVGVETAMRAADVASKLDDAVDAAKTLKKISKIRKGIR